MLFDINSRVTFKIFSAFKPKHYIKPPRPYNITPNVSQCNSCETILINKCADEKKKSQRLSSEL